MEPESQDSEQMSAEPSDASGKTKRPRAMRGVLPTPPLPSPLRNPVVLMTAVGVAIVVAVFWRYWAGYDVTASALLNATFIGIAVGSLYAMYATGLVVVYTTTGIFNFAQGAIGVFCAFLFWELNVNRGWQTLLALFFVVLVFAPALGILLDIVLMRRLRTASMVVQLMATVALMVLLLSLTGEIWEQDTTRTVNFFFGLESSIEIFNVNILWHRLITIFTAIGLAIGLSFLLFRSKLGVAMRAVVDNRELAALNGVRPGLVSSSAWAIGSSLAALGGILIAPEISLDPTNLNIIIITAFAAATFGALRSLPLTILGALIIGLLRQNSLTWLNFGSDLRFVPEAVAPVLLFIVVLALPRAQLTVGRVATNLKQRERLTNPVEAILGLAVLVFLALVLSKGWLNFGIWDPAEWGSAPLNSMNVSMGLAIMGLSLVPLTGWAGQINFAPLAFGGFGAFLFLKLAGIGGINNGWWILLVAVLAAPLGALVAIPASRLRGLYLALASMAFAQAMALLFFPHSAIIPSTSVGIQFGPIRLFGITFSERESYFMLLVSVFAIIVFILVLLRRSRYGRRWIALNDSQAASATVGVSVNLTKVIVYAVSAAIAAVGGAFWATSNGSLEGVRSFDVISGLEIVLLIAAAGVSIPLAGLFLIFRPVFEGLTERLYDLGNVDWLAQFFDIMTTFGPGLLALGMVINQRGAIYEMGRGFAPILPWRKDAREEIAKERAQKRDTEFGELGISRPFTANEAIALDRRLRIADEVTPPGGYGSDGNSSRGDGAGGDDTGNGTRGENTGSNAS